MSSAVATVYVAVDTAIRNDSTVMAILVDRGVYAIGDVPTGQRLTDGGARVGYVEIGTSRETGADTFGSEINDNGLRLAVRATSKKTALTIYRHLKRILDGQPLPSSVMTADSLWAYIAALVFVEDFANPDGGHSAVADYTASVVSTA